MGCGGSLPVATSRDPLSALSHGSPACDLWGRGCTEGGERWRGSRRRFSCSNPLVPITSVTSCPTTRWENRLPSTRSLVPKRSGTAALEKGPGQQRSVSAPEAAETPAWSNRPGQRSAGPALRCGPDCARPAPQLLVAHLSASTLGSTEAEPSIPSAGRSRIDRHFLS